MKLWIELGKRQAEAFQKDNIDFMKALPMCLIPKKILLGCYGVFNNMGKIQKIEELPEDQKAGLKSFSIEISDGRLKKVEELIDLCRCLFVLEYLLTI